jgi:ribonucleoside-diphosphate reductase alpha chain
VMRGRAETVSAALATTLGPVAGAVVADCPESPASCAIAGLAEAAAVRPAVGTKLRHVATVALGRPGPVEAFLGAETGGYAPAFSPLAADGRLTRTAHRALAEQGLSPEAALAALYASRDPLPVPAPEALAEMHAALALIFDAIPAPASPPGISAPRADLPARHTGYTQRAVVGGHRLYLRTGEYDGGRLGEVSIALPRDGAAFRGLMDAFCNAVSIGLQHGVTLEAFVDAFALTRFGPSGAVEGDPAVPYATSVLDYAFRHLAAHYLVRHDLPPAEPVEPEPEPAELPLLAPAARHGLRLVSDRGR